MSCAEECMDGKSIVYRENLVQPQFQASTGRLITYPTMDRWIAILYTSARSVDYVFHHRANASSPISQLSLHNPTTIQLIYETHTA